MRGNLDKIRSRMSDSGIEYVVCSPEEALAMVRDDASSFWNVPAGHSAHAALDVWSFWLWKRPRLQRLQLVFFACVLYLPPGQLLQLLARLCSS